MNATVDLRQSYSQTKLRLFMEDMATFREFSNYHRPAEELGHNLYSLVIGRTLHTEPGTFRGETTGSGPVGVTSVKRKLAVFCGLERISLVTTPQISPHNV
jgi:hypothetical protein